MVGQNFENLEGSVPIISFNLLLECSLPWRFFCVSYLIRTNSNFFEKKCLINFLCQDAFKFKKNLFQEYNVFIFYSNKFLKLKSRPHRHDLFLLRPDRHNLKKFRPHRQSPPITFQADLYFLIEKPVRTKYKNIVSLEQILLKCVLTEVI